MRNSQAESFEGFKERVQAAEASLHSVAVQTGQDSGPMSVELKREQDRLMAEADRLRKEVVNYYEIEAREIEHRLASAPEETRPAEATDSEAETLDSDERRELINSFISKVERDTGRKINRTDVWTVAGYKDATEFERFQRNDTRTTDAATLAFRRVLDMEPREFIDLLDKKRKAQVN